MNKSVIFVLILALGLAFIGVLAGLAEAILLWSRDGHPLGLVLWFLVLGLGGIALFKPIRWILRK